MAIKKSELYSSLWASCASEATNLRKPREFYLAFPKIRQTLSAESSHSPSKTLPEKSNIHASEYQLYLPSKEELKAQITSAAGEVERGQRNT